MNNILYKTLFMVVVLLSSGVLHESVHVLQLWDDSRVEPSYVVFFEPERFATTYTYWTTNNTEEMTEFNSSGNIAALEKEAYFFQYMYVGLMFIMLIKPAARNKHAF